MRIDRLAAPLVVLSCAAGLAAEAKPIPFDPTESAPYFASGPGASAASALRLEDWSRAARGFAAYLKAHPHAKDVHQATFLLGYAELRAGQLDVAASHFDRLVKHYPLLADYERLFAARAYLAAGKEKLSLERSKQIPSDSVLDGSARFIRAESERRLGNKAAAIASYREYLKVYPDSWRVPEVRSRLASTLDDLGDHAAAAVQWRQLYLEAPTQSWGKQAASHLGEAPRFTAAELAQRAMALFDGMRNEESEQEWKKVLLAPGLDQRLTCVARYHEAQSVFKQRQRWRSAPLFDAAVEACQKAKDEDLLVRSLYQAARGWAQKGSADVPSTRKSIALFEQLWRQHPTHSYADDARLREAEQYGELAEEAKVIELLTGLPTAFPDGDRRGEALWRLAFLAWRKGDVAGARRHLERELALLPREDGWWEAGRTLYWLARCADKSGDEKGAAELYARAAREYPLAYYALQAINRLREKWPERASALLTELSGDPVSGKLPAALIDGKRRPHAAPIEEGWRFRPRALFASPAFRRGVELARLGFGSEAKRELALAGIDVPRQRAPITADSDREELLWLAAVLYDHGGEYSLSHFIPRYVLTTYAQKWPVGENRRHWLLSYPRGYRDLIEKNTRRTGQPAALEFAIVREESGFDPLLESFANAIGLTQLTAAPAKRFAGGLPHDSKALRDPAINIAIGARELGHLWSTYKGIAPLAIASYNAGAGAVNRWLRDPTRASLALDEFIESIPYDETRGYTKRVLASYFAYSWLYDQKKAPTLPQQLPVRGP